MAESMNNAPAYGSYPAYFGAMASMAKEYGSMPIENVVAAYARAMRDTNPQVQNRRVKGVSSMPVDYGKDKVAEMIKSPEGNEKPLRQVAHALEWSAYPFFKVRKLYQDITGYFHYTYPVYLEDGDMDASFWREGKLLDKLCRTLKPEQWAHQIVGQAMQEGKVCYIPHYEVDKAHNRVNFAFLQQLPSDWWKIVGFNDVSKYTVMFDLMYFLQPGSDWRQFGDLFAPYLSDFGSVLTGDGAATYGYSYSGAGRVVTPDGRHLSVDVEKFRAMRGTAVGNPTLYNKSGRWAYWVTLPVDRAWVFEVDDTTRTAATPLTGLFLAMDQLASYERVQLEIVQNPLISVVLGEIPYKEDKSGNQSEDGYMLSPTGRTMFEAYWYQMLAASNTGGIGFYTGPFKNLKMESLQEAPNASKISADGYKYSIAKSGLAGLIPIDENPRAGSVNISAAIEEQFCSVVINGISNMMNSIYRSLNLKFDWEFKMINCGLSEKDKLIKQAKEGMTLGILPDTFLYHALRGTSIYSDMAMSRMVKESGILDLRIPLISSYTAKNPDAGLPPQAGNEGGRPTKGIEDVLDGGASEIQEEQIDGDE